MTVNLLWIAWLEEHFKPTDCEEPVGNAEKDEEFERDAEVEKTDVAKEV